MDQEVSVKKELKETKERLNYLISLVEKLSKESSDLVGSAEICRELSWSTRTFHRKKEDLMDYGLYKDGTYKMHRQQFIKYKLERLGVV